VFIYGKTFLCSSAIKIFFLFWLAFGFFMPNLRPNFYNQMKESTAPRGAWMTSYKRPKGAIDWRAIVDAEPAQ
jgi:membrane associated rhomboid family serine protease